MDGLLPTHSEQEGVGAARRTNIVTVGTVRNCAAETIGIGCVCEDTRLSGCRVFGGAAEKVGGFPQFRVDGMALGR